MAHATAWISSVGRSTPCLPGSDRIAAGTIVVDGSDLMRDGVQVEERRGQRGVLHVVVCAAPPASEVGGLVELARSRGWEVQVITTPQATGWVDSETLARVSGRAVRSVSRLPGEEKTVPAPDAIVVAPATFNTINKFRLGVADNYAVGVLCEHLAAGVPIVVAPNVKGVLAGHPAFVESLEQLADWGVHVQPQVQGDDGPQMAPWAEILHAIEHVLVPGG